ncbi:MAG TPA: tetratricopeptide repeat protein [Pseudomonas sp.]|nr:tetratricopeptide repeat protein [Pseudomonas sp.]
MHNSPVVKHTRLLSPWTLLLVALLIGALLVLTYKSEDVFMPDGKTPDAVSVSYAELLLEAHPENRELRLTLIEQLIGLGDYVRARKHVLELSGADTASLPFYELELDVLEALANPAGIEPAASQALVERMRPIAASELSDEQRVRLAKYALSLSAPDIAAPIYADLATRDSERHVEWLAEAAKWYLAAGDSQHAATLYLRLMSLAKEPEQRVEFLEQAFFSLLAANQPEQAAELIDQNLAELRESDSDVLEAAVRAAMGAHRLDLAERFVQVWRTWRPDDQQALAMQFQLRLAAGDIEGAWETSQLMVAARPDDVELLKQVARLGEWTGRPREALDYWIRLLSLGEDTTTREHAWRLAAQLFDFDRAIPLLAMLAEQRRLTDEELDAIVYSHQSRGTPEQGEAWLRGYLRQYPDQKIAWVRLQQILEHTLQYEKEAQVWADMDKRFGLTIAQRLDWAEVHWKLFDVPTAWKVLNDVDNSEIEDADYWRLRGDLAWELEQDDEVRYSYERLLALDLPLTSVAEERLIALYSQHDPEKALALLTKSWQRTHDPRRLSSALQLAEQLQDWPRLQALVDEASKRPDSAKVPALLSARGFLASRAGNTAEAERLYQQGLVQFPRQNIFRQRLLWLYIDSGQRAKLPPLLRQWQGLAQRDGELWLPYASASMLLNRTSEALAWFRLYLNSNPRDWLVQSAYADALESAGYADKALRLRTYLVGRIAAQQQTTVGIERYNMYLRLLTNTQSLRAAGQQAQRWQDGSTPMLQVWFEQFMAQLDSTNQPALKDEWLVWARRQGLEISQYEQLQEALRNHHRENLERLLAEGGLDQAQRVEALTRLGHRGEALGEGLSSLSDEQPGVIRQQLLRQTVELHERTPQGIQLGWQSRDFGGLDIEGPQLQVARYLGDDWYADLTLGQGRYDADTLDDSVIGRENNARLTLQRELSDGFYALTLDGSWRDDEDRLGFGLSRAWALSSRDELQVSLDWHREADQTGLMRALGMRDGVTVAGRHNLSARDQFIWSLAHNRYSTRQGDALGSGQQVNLEYNHALFFEGPTWLLRTGVSYQNNAVKDRLDDELLASRIEVDALGNDVVVPLGGALRLDGATPADLLQDRFGELYVGSTWRRGFPGALNRGRAQYTWLVDVLAGWQWTEQQFSYAINTGVGVEVLGDDELAFTVGYQSAPQTGDGEAGGTVGVTYSARFGR